MRSHFLIISIAWIAFATSVAAQQADLHRTPVLDLTLARHQVSGGFLEFRTGASLDLLVAGALRSTPRWAFVVAAGGSGVAGGFGDICLIRPDGGCAPKANFVVANVLAGVDVKVGSASTRVLLGPALYDGADDSSAGAQMRVDLCSPSLEHVGLGEMPFGGRSAWPIGGRIVSLCA